MEFHYLTSTILTPPHSPPAHRYPDALIIRFPFPPASTQILSKAQLSSPILHEAFPYHSHPRSLQLILKPCN